MHLLEVGPQVSQSSQDLPLSLEVTFSLQLEVPLNGGFSLLVFVGF